MLFGLFGSEEKVGYVDCSKVKTGLHNRCLAAKVLIQKFSGNNSADINEDDFNRFKNIAEELCGIKTLVYDHARKYIDFTNSKINEKVDYPELGVGELVNLTKERLALIAPKLKDYVEEDKKRDTEVIESIKNLGADSMESMNKVIEIMRKADKNLKDIPIETQIEMTKKILENKEFIDVIQKIVPTDIIKEFMAEVNSAEAKEEKTDKKEDDKKEDPVKDNTAVETNSKEETPNTEEKPADEKSEVKDEEKIDPEAPADLGLKTQEQLSVVEFKDPKKRDEKIQEAISEGVENGELKITTPAEKQKPADPVTKEENKQETKNENSVQKTDAKPASKFVATYADKIKEGFTEYQAKMFDKVMKKLEDLVSKDWGEDIKLTNILVKRFDKENKLITFLLENDSKNRPLIEVFYHTGNNKQTTLWYGSANVLVDALKKRKEDSKTDEKMKAKCYNVNFNSIPGYVAPAK